MTPKLKNTKDHLTLEMFQSIKMEELKKEFEKVQTESISVDEELMDLINRSTKMNRGKLCYQK